MACRILEGCSIPDIKAITRMRQLFGAQSHSKVSDENNKPQPLAPPNNNNKNLKSKLLHTHKAHV